MFIAFLSVCMLESCVCLLQGWGTCEPCDHLICPASEFSSPSLEYKIVSNKAP